jgi:fermentation-respiration switch protein FrsA (DUF1100 family)
VHLVLHALENLLVYHPTRAVDDWQPPPNDRVQDVELTTTAATRIHAWWCPLEGATGALLFCHGNAGNLSHRGGSILAIQRELGVSVLIFDYPGYGRSEGKPSEAGCYAAADAAYDWLLRIPQVLAETIFIYGGSLGGGVAVDLACRQPHRALLLASTFTSVPDVGKHNHPWLPCRLVMRNRFDNLAKIKRCQRPVIITHGTADRLIPFRQAEQLFTAANPPKRFYPVPGADHNDPVPTAFFQETRRFLEEVEAGALGSTT